MLKFIEKNKKYALYLPLIVYWIILFILTSLPSPSLPQLAFSDKIKHLGAFFLLGVLLNLTFRFQRKFRNFRKHNVFFTIFIGSFYGILDEIHQIFIPGRSCEFLDWLADLSGLLLSILFVRLIYNKYINI